MKLEFSEFETLMEDVEEQVTEDARRFLPILGEELMPVYPRRTAENARSVGPYIGEPDVADRADGSAPEIDSASLEAFAAAWTPEQGPMGLATAHPAGYPLAVGLSKQARPGFWPSAIQRTLDRLGEGGDE